MSIEGLNKPNAIEKSAEKPVISITNAEQPDKEVTAEKRKQAEKVVLDTLEIEAENLDDFDGKLNQAVKSLPRYQQIEKTVSRSRTAKLTP